MKQQLASPEGPILLLGVSPTLSRLGFDTTAVDRNPAVVRARWSGQAPHRRALVANWLKLPFAASSFVACVGDGSLNALPHPAATSLLRECGGRVLRTGGRFVCRVYLRPDPGETISQVSQAATQGHCRSFLYFKFRLAMAIATEQSDASVPVRVIHDAFEACFPDRNNLAKTTGWDRAEIHKIDLYRTSPEIYSFPTARECLAAIPQGFANARLVAVGTYEMAERCPILVVEKA